ncbi:MAG: sensor histidine kinase [Alistipes indistinctus]
MFVKDPSNEFRYVYWNKAFEEYSHIPASRALGHTDFEIFPRLSDAEKFRRDDLELLRTGQRLEMVEEYTAASGETRVVTTSKALVPSEDRLPLIIGISWDITEQKNAERELIAARIKAEESDRLKSAFLANMSHEIRTPLNAIVGFSKLISSAENAEEVQQYTDIIDSNSDLLLQLINDILDLSKIEAGTLEFHFADMSLNSLCREEYEIHKGRVHDGVELVFDGRDEDVEIKCDHNRLAQVVTNLLSNAIKFTHNGEIRFGYDMMGDTIEFYVADTGIGMSAQAKSGSSTALSN